MDRRPTWTDCDEAGDYVVPNVLSPRDLVSRPDIMVETVPHIAQMDGNLFRIYNQQFNIMKINCSAKSMCQVNSITFILS